MLQGIISVDRLAKVRRRSLRRGVWFRVLGRAERSIADLTLRCVDRVRSPVLARIVTAILIKLKVAMETCVERIVSTMGRSMAQKVSEIARSWGNKFAARWSEDKGFIRYLTIMDLNKP